MCNFNTMCCYNRHWHCCRCRHGCCYPQVRVAGIVEWSEAKENVKNPTGIMEYSETVLLQSTGAPLTPVIACIEQNSNSPDAIKLVEFAAQNAMVEQVDPEPVRSLTLPAVNTQALNDNRSELQMDIRTKPQVEYVSTEAPAETQPEAVPICSLEEANIEKELTTASDQGQMTNVYLTTSPTLKESEPILELRSTNYSKDPSIASEQGASRKSLGIQSQTSKSDKFNPSIVTKSTRESNLASSRLRFLRKQLLQDKNNKKLQSSFNKNEAESQSSSNYFDNVKPNSVANNKSRAYSNSPSIRSNKVGSYKANKPIQVYDNEKDKREASPKKLRNQSPSYAFANVKANSVTNNKSRANTNSYGYRSNELRSLKTKEPIQNFRTRGDGKNQLIANHQGARRFQQSDFKSNGYPFSGRQNYLNSTVPKRQSQPREKAELAGNFNRFGRPMAETLATPNRNVKPINLPKSAKANSIVRPLRTVKKVEPVDQLEESKLKSNVMRKTAVPSSKQIVKSKQGCKAAGEKSEDIWFECRVPFRVSIPNTISCPSPWDLFQTTLCQCQCHGNNNQNMKALIGSMSDVETTTEQPVAGLPSDKISITVRPMPPPSLLPTDFGTNGTRPNKGPPVSKQKTSPTTSTQGVQNNSNRAVGNNKANRPTLENILDVICRCCCNQSVKNQDFPSQPAAECPIIAIPNNPSSMTPSADGNAQMNSQNMTQNNNYNCWNLTPHNNTMPCPQEICNNTMPCHQPENIEEDFKISTPQVGSLQVSNSPTLENLGYKTPSNSGYSMFERDNWKDNEQNRNYNNNSNISNENYEIQNGISQSRPCKCCQKLQNHIAHVKKNSERNSAESCPMERVPERVSRESQENSGRSTRCIQSRKLSSKNNCNCTPVKRLSSQYPDQNFEENRRETNRQNLEESLGVAKSAKHCTCIRPLGKRQSPDMAGRPVAGRSLSNISSQDQSNNSSYVRKVKKVFKPIRRYLAPTNYKLLQQKCYDPTKCIAKNSNNIKDLSDSHYSELPRCKLTSKWRTPILKNDHGKPMHNVSNNCIPNNRRHSSLNRNDSRFFSVLAPPPPVQNSVNRLETARKGVDISRPTNNKPKGLRFSEAHTDSRSPLNASYPKSRSSISESIIQLIRQGNKRRNEGKRVSDQNLTQYFSEESDSDDDNNRNQPKRSLLKDPRLCVLKRENSSSSGTLEEYSVTAFSHSSREYPKQKGGSEFNDRSTERMHLKNLRPIDKQNVDDVLAEVKDYCKSRTSVDRPKKKCVVLMPFRKGNKNDVRITVCEPDEWNELKISMSQITNDRSNPPSLSSNDTFDSNNCHKDERRKRRADNNEDSNIQINKRNLTKVYTTQRSELESSSSMDIKKSTSDIRNLSSKSSKIKRGVTNSLRRQTPWASSIKMDHSESQESVTINMPNLLLNNSKDIGNVYNCKLQPEAEHHVNRFKCRNSDADLQRDNFRRHECRSRRDIQSKRNASAESESCESFDSNLSSCNKIANSKVNNCARYKETLLRSCGKIDYSSESSTQSLHQGKQPRRCHCNTDFSNHKESPNITNNNVNHSTTDFNELSSSGVSLNHSLKPVQGNLDRNGASKIESPQDSSPKNNGQSTSKNAGRNPSNLHTSCRCRREEIHDRTQQKQSMQKKPEDKSKRKLENMPPNKMNMGNCRCSQLEKQNRELLRELQHFHQLLQKSPQMQPTCPQTCQHPVPCPAQISHMPHGQYVSQPMEWQHDQCVQDCLCYGKWLEIRNKLQDVQPQQLQPNQQTATMKVQSTSPTQQQQFQMQHNAKDQTFPNTLYRQPTHMEANYTAVQYSQIPLDQPQSTQKVLLIKPQFPESTNNTQPNQNSCCYCMYKDLKYVPPDIYQQTLAKYGITAMPGNCQQACHMAKDCSCQCGCQQLPQSPQRQQYDVKINK